VNAVLAGQFADRTSGIVLANDRDDLRFREAAFAYG